MGSLSTWGVARWEVRASRPPTSSGQAPASREWPDRVQTRAHVCRPAPAACRHHCGFTGSLQIREGQWAQLFPFLSKTLGRSRLPAFPQNWARHTHRLLVFRSALRRLRTSAGSIPPSRDRVLRPPSGSTPPLPRPVPPGHPCGGLAHVLSNLAPCTFIFDANLKRFSEIEFYPFTYQLK